MPTDQNFGYYTIHDFHSNSDIVECSTNHKAFSALHCNIRSLSANFDNFNHMLSELNYSFSLIGLTETKLRVNIEMLINAKMPGYSYISILCLFMGDFNIDLLKSNGHPESENFINTLGSFFFQPQILQPTRITSHAATLIDNIFLNSIEHYLISGISYMI